MKRQLAITFFVAIMMFGGAYVAQTASADESGMMRGARGMKSDGKMHEIMLGDEHPVWRHLMGVGLNEKQKAEVKEIRHRVMKKMIKKRADECIAGIEMKELMDKDPVDIKAVEAKLKQIETIKTEMQLSLIRAAEEAKSKLTPEQRKKFKEMRAIAPDMEPPMMGGMVHGDMRMPPPHRGKEDEMQPEMRQR